MWLDSHCHVTANRFDGDRAAVLARCFEGGVSELVSIGSGYGIQGNADAIALAETDDRIWATVGVHPHEASELDDENRAAIRAWLAHPRVVALGECGLDYHYMNSPRETQRVADVVSKILYGRLLVVVREQDCVLLALQRLDCGYEVQLVVDLLYNVSDCRVKGCLD